MQRRQLIAALASATAMPLATFAQDRYPSRAVRIVVGFAPGGGADALTRIIAQGLSKQLGQPVVVDNRPGADGTLSALAVASAPADGYTLLMGTNTAMVAAPTLRRATSYDPFKAFTPISSAGQFSVFLVVPNSLPARNVTELLALVAAAPGSYNSASSNSASELAMLQLLGSERKVVNVRYKGDVPALTDMVGGQIQMMFVTGTQAPAFVKDGRVRALLTLQPQRSALLPDVPTAAELGLGKLTITPWAGFFGPAGLPQAITDRLSTELQSTLQRQDVRDQLVLQGFEGYGMDAAKFGAYFRTQYDTFGSMVREHGLKFDQ